MQDAKIRAALLVVCLACLLGSGIVLYAGHQAKAPSVVITNPSPDIPSVTTPPPAAPISQATAPAGSPTRVYVDVAGAVRRPSLYALAPGSRIMQAIRAAGGPTGDADLDTVNLAEKVTDGERVFVPKRGVPPAPTATTTPISPVPLPHPRTVGKATQGANPSRANKLSLDSGEQIALNTATAEQLQRLPGIGSGMAARILAYREQAGGFQKVEDLQMVTGIGPKKFAKIAPLVKLN